MCLRNPNFNPTKSNIMNRFLFSILAIVMISSATFAQDKNYTKHTVAKGETITQIATKYNVTPHDIYNLNPDSQNGIQENDIIIIPTAPKKEAVAKPKTAVANRTHTAKAKETWYSIAREYNVSFEDLKNANADSFASGLKIGQTKSPRKRGKNKCKCN